MRSLPSLILAVAVSSLAVACSADEDGGAPAPGVCEGKCDGAGVVVAAPLWVACWTEADGAETLVRCRQPKNAVWVPGNVFVHVPAASGSEITTLTDEAATVARFPAVSWPIELSFYADPNMGALGTSGLQTNDVRAALRLEANATAAAPATLTAPFSLWPIEIAVASGVALLNVEEQAGSLTPWTDAQGDASFDLEWGTHARAGAAERILVAVPPAGSWRGKLEVLDDGGMSSGRLQVVISGPGRWVAEAGGLRPASAADAALFVTAVEDAPPEPPLEEPVDCEDGVYLAWLGDFGDALGASGDIVSSDERAGLDAQLATRPCTPESDAAYLAWHAIWKDRFDRAVPSATGVVDPDERAVLELVSSVRPEAEGDAAFEAWFAHYGARLASYLPSDTSVIDETERDNLALLAAARPESASELAYVAWLATWRSYFERALPSPTSVLDPSELDNLVTLEAVRPEAAGDQAWTAWFEVFEARLGLAGDWVDDGERAALEALARVKACGGADSAVTFAAVSGGDDAARALGDPASCR